MTTTATADFIMSPGPRRDGQTFVSACLKVPGGIRQLYHWYPHVDPDRVRADTAVVGNFSPRPFVPGQLCDLTGDVCVKALFADLCRAQGWDANQIFEDAYPFHHQDYLQDFVDAQARADWQGVRYPQSWCPDTITALCASLRHLHYQNVVEVIEDRLALTSVR